MELVDEKDTNEVVTVTVNDVDIPVRTDAVNDPLLALYVGIADDDNESATERMHAQHRMLRMLIGPGYVRYLEKVAGDGALTVDGLTDILVTVFEGLAAKN